MTGGRIRREEGYAIVFPFRGYYMINIFSAEHENRSTRPSLDEKLGFPPVMPVSVIAAYAAYLRKVRHLTHRIQQLARDTNMVAMEEFMKRQRVSALEKWQPFG